MSLFASVTKLHDRTGLRSEKEGKEEDPGLAGRKVINFPDRQASSSISSSQYIKSRRRISQECE